MSFVSHREAMVFQEAVFWNTKHRGFLNFQFPRPVSSVKTNVAVMQLHVAVLGLELRTVDSQTTDVT